MCGTFPPAVALHGTGRSGMGDGWGGGPELGAGADTSSRSSGLEDEEKLFEEEDEEEERRTGGGTKQHLPSTEQLSSLLMPLQLDAELKLGDEQAGNNLWLGSASS